MGVGGGRGVGVPVGVLVLAILGLGMACPAPCNCGYEFVAHLNTSMYVSNCSHGQLEHLPAGLPNNTEYLDISHNDFELVSENRLVAFRELAYLDVRANRRLHSLPLMRGLDNITALYVDDGAVCCIYEVEWERAEGKSRRKTAAMVCRATKPYMECTRHLIRIPSIVIYSVTFVVSLAFNPWVFVLTLVMPARRRDPFTLANVHFSMSNMMITVYAGGMLVVGSCLYDKYHYHMEEWLENPACGVLGFILVTASLASTFFYTFEIIIVFLKVKYPFQEDRHMSTLHLNIATAITWASSVGVAAIPFGLGRYNAVGLCLPFYAGDYDFSFKYVLLYACITNLATVFNMAMHIYVLKLFIHKSKETTGSLCEQRRKENRTLRNTVVITLVFYVLISSSEMVFLIMSCVGGAAGQVGREWWARMVVLEALINPLTGPMRSKRFYRETRAFWSNFRYQHCRKDTRHPSTIGKGATIDLKKLKDKQEKPKHDILTDSPSLAFFSDRPRNGKVAQTISDSSEASPDLPRINFSWKDIKHTDNKVSTISALNLQNIQNKMTRYETQLGASPVSKTTLVSDISDTDSEKGIT